MIKSFTVLGEPVGKGRPRATGSNGRIHCYTPKATSDYESLIRSTYMARCQNYNFGDAAVSMEIIAGFQIPKSKNSETREKMIVGEVCPCKKPDADNILKIIMDALNGVAYNDDKQVILTKVRKAYADKPFVDITICDLEI